MSLYWNHDPTSDACPCLGCDMADRMWRRVADAMRRKLDAQAYAVLQVRQRLTKDCMPGNDIVALGAPPWNPSWPTQEPPPPPDPMTQPLPPAPPPTWKEREDRVRWCRENLTRGERALLIRLDYDDTRTGIKRTDCDKIIDAERKACV